MQFSWSGFNNSKREEEEENLVFFDKFFGNLLDVFEKKSFDFSRYFYLKMVPKSENFTYMEENLNNVYNKTNESQPRLRKSLQESLDDIEK